VLTPKKIREYSFEDQLLALNVGFMARLHFNVLHVNKDFNSDVTKLLAETQTKAYEFQEKDAALEDRLSRVIMRAWDDGMVIGKYPYKINRVFIAIT
jgi:Na+-transporting NADH:ubiquinone oxidoreductase subunit NqrC